MIKQIWNRLYEQFLMSSRLKEYESIIELSLAKGYEHITLLEFLQRVDSGTVDPAKRYFLHRHDIDSDLRTSKKMFAIEQKYGIRTSYYFRRLTIDIPFMQAIHAFGSEACYHYEELADYCKANKIKTPEKARAVFPECQELFRMNFLELEQRLGYKMKTVASHGDFVNRKLGIANHAFVDQQLLDELGIAAECYDQRIIGNLSYIGSDMGYPQFYRPTPPFKAIEEGLPVVYLLTHPNHWEVNVWSNIRETWIRIKEGIIFKYF